MGTFSHVYYNHTLSLAHTPRGFEVEKQRVIVQSMMESASVPLNEPPQSKSWWQAANVPPAVGVYSVRFSPRITLMSALFLVVALASILWLSASASKLDQVESPEQALNLMVSRTMDMQEGLKRAPRWEQLLFSWTSDDSDTELAHEIEWYRELSEISEDQYHSII